MFKEILNLISVTITETESGSYIESKTSKQVFADKKSVRQSEFYQAAQAGIKPEIVFVIRYIDYAGERLLEYDNLEYSVIRTFLASDEMIELVATRTVNREGES